MEPEINKQRLEVSTPALNSLRDAKNWVPLSQEPAYKPRRIRIVCVGAGYSGLMTAYEIKYNKALESFIDFTIYDKNEDVGGTWLENRYPGVAVRCSVRDMIALFTDIRELSAMFPRISTPFLLSLTRTGLHFTLQAPRSGPI
jgi:cation diffusion facilitator CzcD-associated flavoprotein CzcO